MNRKNPTWLIIVILTAGIAIWYLQLKEHQKAFLTNLLRQIPDMPGRYMI